MRLVQHATPGSSLQRTLLPKRLPAVPGVSLAARHLPASVPEGVGGGWYDAFTLGDGSVGLAVGDVASRGTRAAQLMGEQRAALRAYAVDADGPGTVAKRMRQFVDGMQPGEMATFLYAVYDPTENSVRYAGAAHPAPAFIAADGSVSFGEIAPAPPLGAGVSQDPVESTARLEPGTTMLLYTDALVERRGERLGDRRARLACEASVVNADLEGLCGRLLDRLLDGTGPEDDVALLAIRADAMPEDALRVTLTAAPEELPVLRRHLRRWLTARGADEREVAAITFATQEACANAVEHAYGLVDETFHVAADHDGSAVEVTVRDRGRWRPPRGENRGRGLMLMRTFVDDVEVAPDERGTTVRLLHRLRNGRRA